MCVKLKRLCVSAVFPNWARVTGAFAYQMTGQTTKAIQTYQAGIDFEPESSLCHFYLMDLLVETGDLDRAEKLAEQVRSADNPMDVGVLIQSISHNPTERERVRRNMAVMGFVE